MRLLWALKDLALLKSGDEGNTEGQNSQDQAFQWELNSWRTIRAPVLTETPWPHATQWQSPAAGTHKIGKTKIQSHFHSHRNEGQYPKQIVKQY